jgi:dienelactone hydrolase
VRSTRRARVLAILALAALGAVLFLAIRFGPTLLFAVALAAPAAEPWLARVLAEPREEEITFEAGRRIAADLYRPAAPRQAMLLVHGLSPAGRRQPDLVRLARLLARHGGLVLVPHFDGLAEFRLSGREIDEIGAGIAALARLAGPGPPLVVLGFSFGAGPALLAAAAAPDVRRAGSFGGYAELRNVLVYITTGTHAFEGRHYAQPFEEYNRWKLLALLAGLVDDGRNGARLAAIAGRKLANPFDDTRDEERALGGDGRAVMALVRNRDADAVTTLLADLGPRTRAAMARLSPLPAAAVLGERLLLAHGEGDESIPFTETLRLAEAAGGRARTVILRGFHHTGPGPTWCAWLTRAADGPRFLALVDALLTAP